jgi:hypothetical protein
MFFPALTNKHVHLCISSELFQMSQTEKKIQMHDKDKSSRVYLITITAD